MIVFGNPTAYELLRVRPYLSSGLSGSGAEVDLRELRSARETGPLASCGEAWRWREEVDGRVETYP